MIIAHRFAVAKQFLSIVFLVRFSAFPDEYRSSCRACDDQKDDVEQRIGSISCFHRCGFNSGSVLRRRGRRLRRDCPGDCPRRTGISYQFFAPRTCRIIGCRRNDRYLFSLRCTAVRTLRLYTVLRILRRSSCIQNITVFGSC